MAKNLYDSFTILKKKELSSDDIYSLTYLYMPLLGIDSYSLYIGLSTFDVGEEYNYKMVLDLLSLRGLSSITNAMNKLEGLGLVREFKNGEMTLYILNEPLSVTSFIQDESLRALLVSEVGEDQVLKLYEKHANNYKTKYKEVTLNFSDVFDIDTENKEKIYKNIFGVSKDDLVIDNEEFNYTLFEMNFNSSFITDEILNDKSFKQNIIRLSKVYKLNEDQMTNCVIKSFDIDKDLSYATLAKNAKLIFRNEYEVDSPRLVSKETDQYMESVKDDEFILLSEQLENMSCADLLMKLSGAKPAESEIAMFDTLYGNSNLSIGAINVMIMMVNYEKEGVLPGLTYFEKIANTWMRAKVKNAYDALMFTQRESDKKKNKKQKTGKYEVKVPSWYEEYRKQVEQATSSDAKPEMQSKELLEAAKELFGD